MSIVTVHCGLNKIKLASDAQYKIATVLYTAVETETNT